MEDPQPSRHKNYKQKNHNTYLDILQSPPTNLHKIYPSPDNLPQLLHTLPQLFFVSLIINTIQLNPNTKPLEPPRRLPHGPNNLHHDPRPSPRIPTVLIPPLIRLAT
jgi:hypothetical protein